MGKVKWNTSGSEVDQVEVEERETFEPYDGPIPPNNSVLQVSLKWARVADFNSGNGGLKLLMEVAEPDGSPKAKYNGCPLFENLVDVDTQAWKIRQWLDAIGGTGKDWDGCVSADDGNGNEVITKFGRVKADGLKLRVQTQVEVYEGERRAKVRNYLPKVSGGSDSKSSKGSSGGGDEPPF